MRMAELLKLRWSGSPASASSEDRTQDDKKEGER